MKRYIFHGFFLLILTACAGATKLHEAKIIEPTGTKFQKTLYQEYITQAEKEQAHGDTEDVDFYASRAIIAGSGYRVEPYQVDENGLPTETAPIFRKAKNRLNAALSSGARKQAPYRAARAQAAYDCWWEEVVDNNGLTQRAAVCRDRFRSSMDEIETLMSEQDSQ